MYICIKFKRIYNKMRNLRNVKYKGFEINETPKSYLDSKYEILDKDKSGVCGANTIKRTKELIDRLIK